MLHMVGVAQSVPWEGCQPCPYPYILTLTSLEACLEEMTDLKEIKYTQN